MRNAGLFEIYLFAQRYIAAWLRLAERRIGLAFAWDPKFLIFSWMDFVSIANCVN